MKKIKQFFKDNGFESVLAGAAALVLFVLGFKGWAMFCIGWFACRNRVVLGNLYKTEVKPEVDKLVKKVRK